MRPFMCPPYLAADSDQASLGSSISLCHLEDRLGGSSLASGRASCTLQGKEAQAMERMSPGKIIGVVGLIVYAVFFLALGFSRSASFGGFAQWCSKAGTCVHPEWFVLAAGCLIGAALLYRFAR
jgi:hypothetical protein